VRPMAEQGDEKASPKRPAVVLVPRLEGGARGGGEGVAGGRGRGDGDDE